jgi:phosphoenolpyruvate carboxylase
MQKKTRKIPATMVTQHPDHAAAPFWHKDAFIPASDETVECFLSFSELGATEYKWDWEGKLVDEAVIDRLLIDHFDYFQKNGLGKEKFLTFRLPNPKVETEFRLGRAFMGMITASSLARHVGYTHHPLFEVILPMTETAIEMLSVQQAFAEIASLRHPLLKHGNESLKHIELIPLFEEISIIADTANILEEYVKLHKSTFGFTPSYMRPYVARSDPALNAGIVPTVISIKIALSRLKQFSKKSGIELYPIIGAASLPFRGGLSPVTVEDFAKEYAGIRTTTIQSGFKYDYPKEDVKKAIAYLEETLPKGKPQSISAEEETILFSVMKAFEPLYKEVVEGIAPVINAVSKYVPKRRERVQHVGLFGYSRGVGSVKLPRAIGFTAALYSVGVPPELIGTGRGLHMAKQMGWLPAIEKFYLNIKKDLQRSGSYLNKKNLTHLAKKDHSWHLIAEDVAYIEAYLGETLGPRTDEEKEHEKLTGKILSGLEQKKDIGQLIEKAALLRRSMG